MLFLCGNTKEVSKALEYWNYGRILSGRVPSGLWGNQVSYVSRTPQKLLTEHKSHPILLLAATANQPLEITSSGGEDDVTHSQWVPIGSSF